jgi:hypothetical protein
MPSNFRSLPVIDISSLYTKDSEARRKVAE